MLRRALALWRGDPFQGVDLIELEGHIQQLEERRLIAYEELFTAELASGRGTHVVLIDELGLEPGAELQAIERRILAGESIGPETPGPATTAQPAQLPPESRGFVVGREAELSFLDDLAKGPTRARRRSLLWALPG